jgi:hypothetical protein
MKLSRYRTCEYCFHFRLGRNASTFCRLSGLEKQFGNGCVSFEAFDSKVELVIREYEIQAARRELHIAI